MTVPEIATGDRVVQMGFGITGQAVAAALSNRGVDVTVVDDAPSDAALAAAATLGVDLVAAPDLAALSTILDGAAALLPTPGLPDHHRAFDAARTAGVQVLSEFDLARQWDDRPVVAITGTNGKTTVTMMVTDMLDRSGRPAAAVGNTDVPLVEAIDDPTIEVFVAEASSFRLGHSGCFTPAVGTWLNFDPDHLDVHRDLEAYERSKAVIWRDQPAEAVAVANAEDPIVMRNLTGAARRITFGLDHGDNRLIDGVLHVGGSPLVAADDLARALPHDVANALAAATSALEIGADREAVAETLRTFTGLSHRVELVGSADGVSWYDDSKATTPHAVLAALSGFDSAVLIAGGRNKGTDLGRLAAAADRLQAVIAIGDAAAEVVAAFDGIVTTVVADDMSTAVLAAAGAAAPGDSVVLSPGCASFDWYRNYGERGDHFASLVRELILEAQ